MFLKFLDDLEQQREDEAKLAGRKVRPAIEAPYRWRDWAANPAGVTGDELLAFINQDEAVRPDGSRGPGLFAYLRHLTSANGDDRRDVIATVFRGVDNRMIVPPRVAEISFEQLAVSLVGQRHQDDRVAVGDVPRLVGLNRVEYCRQQIVAVGCRLRGHGHE